MPESWRFAGRKSEYRLLTVRFFGILATSAGNICPLRTRFEELRPAIMARESKGWHAEDIKAELRKRLGPITSLSGSWGWSRTAISKVLRRPDYSPPLERRIAEALGVEPHEIWPDRWHPDGTPKKRVLGIVPAGNSPGGPNPSHASTNPHRQKREAA